VGKGSAAGDAYNLGVGVGHGLARSRKLTISARR
jgi:hypothetical protein